GCMVLASNAEERFATVTLKNGNTASLAIIIAQEDAQAMEDAGAVFVKAFADYYSQFSLEQLYLKDEPDIRTTFLKAAFEDEKKDF
ncbi:hypothetical protein, partial [Klebsiella pneumoniae]|uniref:hypothetical protein n=1 Tax=Klebsiella pneumoniae TaxID=573 RepID=UPI0025530E7C